MLIKAGILRLMPRATDMTIIGGGPVGLFAAFYAGMRGMSVRIVDSLSELGGQLTALYPEKYVYDMPGFPAVLARDLAQGMADQALAFKPELALGETAQSLDRQGEHWVVGTDVGASYASKTVLISAGAGAFSPTRLGVENEAHFEGRGVSYGVRDKSAFAGKDVLVVGGGDSAVDWMLNLHGIAGRLRLVHRRDVFKAHEESLKEIDKRGLEKLLFRAVVDLHGDDCLTGVTLQDTVTKETETVACDAVVVNIGFKSSLGPIKDWGLEIDKNQVVVDHLYQTCLPGVFSVGDVATYDGKIKLIATGVGEAATAVCVAKMLIDPASKLFPGHSSDLSLPH